MRPAVGRRTQVATALATLVLTLLLPTRALADHCEYGSVEDKFGHTCVTPGDGEPGGGGGTGVDYDSMGPVFTVMTTTVDGVECWMIATGGTMTWGEAVELLEWLDGNREDTSPEACDFEPADLTPDLWTEGLCPPPAPAPLVVSPDGRAITGLQAFLEIRGPRTVDVPCGDGVIQATARYVVEWGDGTSVETTSRGGPYPDGDLTHVYQSVGGPTITVSAYWTGTIDGITLPELPIPTTSTLPLDVDQVQAVVNG